ncbi:MAG: SpoIIE family protein phosphatase [Actinomycetia bacterium]|nr:SpoIIE family protein phosphatase [Actinomycetes bacterium]
MDMRPRARVPLPDLIAGLGLLVLLFAIRDVSYTFFHSLAELFAIVVAACIFMVMWNSRRYVNNGALVFIGVASLPIAAVDVLHMLTYSGMAVIPAVKPDVATQLWVIGRVLQATALLLAPSFIDRRAQEPFWLTAWAVPTAVLLWVVFKTNWFPECLTPAGLTTFKIAAEWAIAAALALALVRFRRDATRFHPDVLRLISWSIAATVASELTFTLYTDPYSATNLVGHFLRIIAFYLLYRAIIATALREPHAVLFKELADQNETLMETERAIRRAKEFSDALSDIDSAVNSTLDLHEVLSRAIVAATTALHADAATISIKEGDVWTIRLVHHMPDSLIGTQRDRMSASHLYETAETRRPMIVEDVPADGDASGDLARDLGVTALMTVPLMAGGEVIGILTFYVLARGHGFTPEQLNFASRLSSSLSLAIENARLYDAQKKIAEELQTPMLSFPDELPGVKFGHAYRSVEELARIGGDFYDAFELGNGSVAVVVGDVSGKGMAAATASSITRTTFRAFGLHLRAPRAVLSAVNEVLVRLLPDGSFATATYAVIDIATGDLTAASAGHPDPFVCTRLGCYRQDARRNQPLGLWDDVVFDEFTLKLAPGDSVVLFSDGLLDTRRNKEFFGEERVEEVLTKMRDAKPQEIVDALMDAVARFSGTQHTDDIAIVAATLRAETV